MCCDVFTSDSGGSRRHELPIPLTMVHLSHQVHDGSAGIGMCCGVSQHAKYKPYSFWLFLLFLNIHNAETQQDLNTRAAPTSDSQLMKPYNIE
jgi:hypothetical protein